LEVTGQKPEFVPVSETFLEEEGVGAYTELPLWIPESRASINGEKALKAGLQIRPLAETVRETLAWHESRPLKYELQAGLLETREVELLERWDRLKNS
jgi:2'-hydroxyisoflavone reductase